MSAWISLPISSNGEFPICFELNANSVIISIISTPLHIRLYSKNENLAVDLELMASDNIFQNDVYMFACTVQDSGFHFFVA